MKQYKELALTGREVVYFLRRQAEVEWNSGRKYLVEWNERKGDAIYQMIDQYEGEVIKLKRCVYALIQSSDEPLSLNINSRDLEEMRPPFHRLL